MSPASADTLPPSRYADTHRAAFERLDVPAALLPSD